MRQKLELLAEDIASLAVALRQKRSYRPTSMRNIGDFMVEPRLSLRQIYFSRDRQRLCRRAGCPRFAAAYFHGQTGSRISRNLGDPLPLAACKWPTCAREKLPACSVTMFTDGLKGLEPGRWSGPVESGFGLHLVFIRGSREQGRVHPNWPKSVKRCKA